jgi:hypothetical protein
MNPPIRIGEYKAVLEDTVINFIADKLQEQKITLLRAQEITSFFKENIEKPTTVEEISLLIEKTKNQFPELKPIIEEAISTFEEHKKYKIS